MKTGPSNGPRLLHRSQERSQTSQKYTMNGTLFGLKCGTLFVKASRLHAQHQLRHVVLGYRFGEFIFASAERRALVVQAVGLALQDQIVESLVEKLLRLAFLRLAKSGSSRMNNKFGLQICRLSFEYGLLTQETLRDLPAVLPKELLSVVKTRQHVQVGPLLVHAAPLHARNEIKNRIWVV
jgi:hypothetical protein